MLKRRMNSKDLVDGNVKYYDSQEVQEINELFKKFQDDINCQDHLNTLTLKNLALLSFVFLLLSKYYLIHTSLKNLPPLVY